MTRARLRVYLNGGDDPIEFWVEVEDGSARLRACDGVGSGAWLSARGLVVEVDAVEGEEEGEDEAA